MNIIWFNLITYPHTYPQIYLHQYWAKNLPGLAEFQAYSKTIMQQIPDWISAAISGYPFIKYAYIYTENVVPVVPVVPKPVINWILNKS